uniref:Uncharacterized protein n=1 Tax=mine drainage metagenome TaxID=410659 RepID=E6PG67_9ZZZZ
MTDEKRGGDGGLYVKHYTTGKVSFGRRLFHVFYGRELVSIIYAVGAPGTALGLLLISPPDIFGSILAAVTTGAFIADIVTHARSGRWLLGRRILAPLVAAGPIYVAFNEAKIMGISGTEIVGGTFLNVWIGVFIVLTALYAIGVYRWGDEKPTWWPHTR